MTITHKQFGQSRPADTAAASIYSPADGITATVTRISVCNTSSSDATFSVYIDADGTTYDQTTALYYQVPLAAKQTAVLTEFLPISSSSGNLAVQSSVASALTFTVNGAEES